MYTQTVALRDVSCHAYHGFYPEEQLIGGIFMVDVEVTFTPSNDTENLAKTVNYEVLNHIVLQEMKQTQKLLETVVKNMLTAVKESYPFILTAKVGIRKMNPPMPGQIGHSFVELSYNAL
ncbi:dihydroneopterin aldolase [Pedobacter sp.]